VPNFKAIIANATYLKLQNDPASLQALVTARKTKTFLSYYTPANGVVRVNSGYNQLILDVVHHIGEQAVSANKFDFISLCDKPELGGWNYLEGYLKERLSDDMKRQLRLNL
jgi:hypothetical protein